MRDTRVLLVGLPRTTRELITGLLDTQAGVSIVDESSEAELLEAVRRARANVVIVAATDAGIPDAVRRLLEDRALRVVVLTERGRSSTVGELVPMYTHVDELTSSSLTRMLTGTRA